MSHCQCSKSCFWASEVVSAPPYQHGHMAGALPEVRRCCIVLNFSHGTSVKGHVVGQWFCPDLLQDRRKHPFTWSPSSHIHQARSAVPISFSKCLKQEKNSVRIKYKKTRVFFGPTKSTVRKCSCSGACNILFSLQNLTFLYQLAFISHLHLIARQNHPHCHLQQNMILSPNQAAQRYLGNNRHCHTLALRPFWGPSCQPYILFCVLMA